MKKNRSARKERKVPEWEKGLDRVAIGPLGGMLGHGGAHVRCDDKYSIAKTDWGYVTNQGEIRLNPHRDAPAAQWEYVIGHCLLHLGFGHFQRQRMADPRWIRACDMVVTRFLRDGHIGTVPPDFQHELPCVVRDEETTCAYLSDHPECKGSWSTMTGGRPDFVWKDEPDREYGPWRRTVPDFAELLARSLQTNIQNSLRGEKEPVSERTTYGDAREWFLSSYPLLGGIASSFRIVDEEETVRRLGIPVAAVSPQLQEIYINPRCILTEEEWKFVLAHEFLHAALRHDVRLEDRDPELWNVACDYVVNGWLVEMNVAMMPEFALWDARFNGQSVEAVYDSICLEIRRYKKENTGDLLYGDPAFWDRLEGQDLDAYYRSAIGRGLSYWEENRGRGLLPSGLVEEIYAVSRPPIRWDVELAKWFDARFPVHEKSRSYTRLSRRQSSTPDIPRPGLRMNEEVEEQRTFGVLLDTSGSMDRALLAASLGAIASYSASRDVRHVRVVFCDAAAYDQGIMSPDEIAGKVRVRGRGGTVLQPGIDLLDRDETFPGDAPLLIITDGECDRLNLRGREHAFLVPYGRHLPFPPKGPVFKLK